MASAPRGLCSSSCPVAHPTLPGLVGGKAWSSVVRASETKPLSGAGLPWSSGGAAGQPVHLGVTECHRAHPPQLPSSWGRCLRPLGLTTPLGRLAIPGDSLVVTVEVQWVEARDVLNALLCTGQPPLRRVSPRPQCSQSRPLVQMPVMLSGQCQGLPIPLLPLLGGACSPCWVVHAAPAACGLDAFGPQPGAQEAVLGFYFYLCSDSSIQKMPANTQL